MIMKMLAVTAFTLSLAGGAFAQTTTAPVDNMQMPNSECPNGKGSAIDNKACQDSTMTNSVTPMAPAATPSDPAQDAVSKCPDGKASGIDNKACADIK